MKSFTALDFETAHGKRWSICQVGLVRVENAIYCRYWFTSPITERLMKIKSTVKGINDTKFNIFVCQED